MFQSSMLSRLCVYLYCLRSGESRPARPRAPPRPDPAVESPKVSIQSLQVSPTSHPPTFLVKDEVVLLVLSDDVMLFVKFHLHARWRGQRRERICASRCGTAPLRSSPAVYVPSRSMTRSRPAHLLHTLSAFILYLSRRVCIQGILFDYTAIYYFLTFLPSPISRQSPVLLIFHHISHILSHRDAQMAHNPP